MDSALLHRPLMPGSRAECQVASLILTRGQRALEAEENLNFLIQQNENANSKTEIDEKYKTKSQ